MIPALRSVRIWILALTLPLAIAANCGAEPPRLGVTPAQKRQLKALAMDTREKTERERETLRHARLDLLHVYMDYNLDEHKAKVALDKINKAQFDLLNAHLDNQIALRGILNADQFAAFTNMVMRRRGPGVAGLAGPADDMLPGVGLNKRTIDSMNLNPDERKKGEALATQMRRRGKIVEKLRRDTRQMLDLYSNYNLDVPAARKLIDGIHRDQITLSEMNHKKQQLLRSVLDEGQFQQIKSDAAQRMHDFRDRPGK